MQKEKDNKYSLLNYHMDDKMAGRPVDYQDRNECNDSIDGLLKEFKEGLRKLEVRYPRAGIGDTATDECIAEEFYNVIHGL